MTIVKQQAMNIPYQPSQPQKKQMFHYYLDTPREMQHYNFHYNKKRTPSKKQMHTHVFHSYYRPNKQKAHLTF
ncbi:hypothetical protein PU24_06785 [Escherichia coli]|nr:hypothetical protein [Salmonella enterica]KHG90524.1 hypothetical protein PU74_00930 [Escherichia coli]KHG90916.1 hypothetical protein PU72_25495 [Escherichia coli]KHH06904.1 hypothetical protein PU68_24400 [Escherichia coli]KHH11109.1 hypothetical protein PU67_25465 [Escherichia coli]